MSKSSGSTDDLVPAECPSPDLAGPLLPGTQTTSSLSATDQLHPHLKNYSSTDEDPESRCCVSLLRSSMGGNGARRPPQHGDETAGDISDDHHLEAVTGAGVPKQSPAPFRRTSLKRNTPTAFLLRKEDDLCRTRSTSPRPSDLTNSDFGVTSLPNSTISLDDQTTISVESEKAQRQQNEDRKPLSPIRTFDFPQASTDVPSSSPPSPPSCRSSPVHHLTRELSAGELSRPLTPYHLRALQAHSEMGATSTPRSVSLRSLRLSDDDAATNDAASQAIASDDEDEEIEQSLEQPQSALQLVMPSLRMPARRPFTERGKDIGKLKILVAGSKGTGKTSLIKAIVQSCEDIVHVDLLSDSTSSLSFGRNTDLLNSKTTVTASLATEIFASTRAYPSWWSEMEDNKILAKRRRSSMNEPVLERNICFIDTPGISFDSVSEQSSDPAFQYLERQLDRTLSFVSLSDGEVLSILGGSGGVQVDLVLYVLPSKPSDGDIEAIRELSSLSNVIPMIGKSDLLSESEANEAAANVSKTLHNAGIKTIDLVASARDSGHEGSDLRTWLVSSATTRDDELMDASLLMNSEYIQPLAPSSLRSLVETIFRPDTAARLRHLAAKKSLDWRRTRLEVLQALQSRSAAGNGDAISSDRVSSAGEPSYLSSPSASQVLVSRPFISGTSLLPTTASPYTLARLADHKQREETLTQVHLARWAVDLQRTLRDEREKYEQLGREERQTWLLEKWGECASEKGVAADTVGKVTPALRVDTQDPLGFLAWDDSIRKRGLVIAKVLGSCGIIGAIMVWMMRTWGLEGDSSKTGSNADHSWSQSWLGSVR